MNRRRLGQQMILDKQKKDEDSMRRQAEEIRRDRLEQQKLQEKLKAQIQQDREDKRRKYEEGKSSSIPPSKPKVTTNDAETTKVQYTRCRLQFRLIDGSSFTEDFPCDARMNDVYAYLHETLPTDQYRQGSYTLRTTHTRQVLTREDPKTLKDLDLVPSAVLLVVSRGGNPSSPAVGGGTASATVSQALQSIPLLFTWLMMQFNFLYLLIASKLFGTRPSTASSEQRPRPSAASRGPARSQPKAPKESFSSESTDKSTVRRFRNTQDDSDDEEKRTWNGNSTQQL